jgi:cyclomaltodextrinase / maltogenic alpha-amylase / neopullulanase
VSDGPRVPVVFELHEAPGRLVELLGDFPSWKHPRAMIEAGPGRYRLELSLAPGIYRYKMRIGGERWVSDPSAQAIDRAEWDNGLCIVGGTSPPLFFAPDSRHLVRERSGRIAVHAEWAGEGTPPSRIWVDAGGVVVLAPLVEIGSRADRKLLRAELSAPLGEGWIGFEGRRECFLLPRPCSEWGEPPAWAQSAVFYAIFVDRWHRGSSSQPEPRASSRGAPSKLETFYGGDLDGVREWLPYLADLGVDAIVLTPVHASESTHRYDATDLLAIDPRLGGERALARLIEEAHRAEIRVVLDAAFTHVSARHPAFRDLLDRQERSPYAGWFRVRRFPVREGDGATFEHYYRATHLPRLALENREARAHVIAAAKKLADLGADGLRLDAMDEAPDDFWIELRATLRRAHPELLFLGEVVIDRADRYAKERGVDLATDFKLRETLTEHFARGRIDAAELWSRTIFDAFRVGPFGPAFRLSFLDNHDTARFRSIAIQHDRLRLALVYLLTRPEPVWLTYATELGMAGGSTDLDLENVWPERQPMPDQDALETKTRSAVRSLLRLRRELGALRSDTTRLICAERGLYVVERGDPSVDDPTIIVAINADDREATLPLLPSNAAVLLDTASMGREALAPDQPLAPTSARIIRNDSWVRPDNDRWSHG